MTEQQRCTIVTGGGRGIGRAIAMRLSRDGHAVAVLEMDRSAAAEVVSAIESEGGQALAVKDRRGPH